MPELRVFYAHGKAVGDDEIDRGKAAVAALVAARLARKGVVGFHVEVVSGLDDWHRSGVGWDGWTRRVALSTKPGTPEPLYHTIVSPDARVGRATAGILAMALRAGKRCFWWDGADGLFLVAEARKVSTSWQGGHALILAGGLAAPHVDS